MSQWIRLFSAVPMFVGMFIAGFAQPKTPTEPLEISVDFARFRGDDKNAYVEVYYGFPQWQLTYVQGSSGMKAAIDLTTLVMNKDSIFSAERVRVEHTLVDSIGRASLIHLSKLMLAPGDYLLKVIAKDVYNSSRHDSVMRNLPARVFPEQKLVLSDIELASAMRKGKEGALFYKNTLEVVPNPEVIFGETQSCYYYAEAYNLLIGEDRSDYTLKTAVYNAVGREVISREKPRKRSGESAVLVDQLDVTKLRSGTYTLVLSLLDSAKKPAASAGKKFFVYNSVLGVDSSLMRLDPALSLSVFSTMEEAELDRDFKWTKWEARDEERDQFENLKGAEPKRKFLTEFWNKRPIGLRETYMRRVAEANARYQSLGIEGYRSDRGRVHVLYGPPDDIDRHPNESGTRPYEIWSYNQIQGGVVFIFVLRQNGGDYDLVHSTHRNELHDENWERYARTN